MIDASTVSNILDEVGKRLSSPAEHAYNILTTQAITDGVGGVFIGLAAITFSAVCSFYANKVKNNIKNKKENNKHVDCDNDWIGFGAVAVVAILSGLRGCCELVDSVKHIVNPEYYAIMDIICNIKQ